MNGTKTDVMTDSKACSIHSKIGAIADTEAGATADPKIHLIFLLLQLSTPIVSKFARSHNSTAYVQFISN